MARVRTKRSKRPVTPDPKDQERPEVLVTKWYKDERGRYFQTGENPIIVNTRPTYLGISRVGTVQSGLKEITEIEFHEVVFKVGKELGLWKITVKAQ